MIRQLLKEDGKEDIQRMGKKRKRKKQQDEMEMI